MPGYFTSAQDCTAARRLLDAGAISLGKLNMTELALGASGDNAHHGDADNPWLAGHATGGSSSGSGAGVAAGFLLGAVGSDTGGSIRLPAACCGVVGLKPTYGRVNRAGIPEPAPALAPLKRATLEEFNARSGRFSRLTRPFNGYGLPALSMPCGFTTTGLPLAFQAAGRPFDEGLLLRLGHAYQEASGWHLRRPRRQDPPASRAARSQGRAVLPVTGRGVARRRR